MINNPFTDYQPAPGLLQGRTILVTGAGSGLGQAVAKACGALGATLILLGRTESKLAETYDAIESAGGPQPAIFPFNLETSTEDDYLRLGETIYQEFGQLDGLLHCAAQLMLLSRVDDYDQESWNKVMQINLTAPFMLTKACLPLLRRSPDASVLFATDRVGELGKAYWGAYGVSKAGLDNLMRMLANELENSQIRVNSIDPGPLRTRIRALAYPGEDMQTLPAAEFVVPGFVYLLGPDARGINGQILRAQN